MLFPREGLLSRFGQPFNDSIRPSLPTIAEPAWFAPPIDVKQDDGTHRAMRVFALPFEVAPHDLHTSRSGELLRVRISKKMARMSPDPTAQAA